jgi:16S rRNA processing protein RimM
MDPNTHTSSATRLIALGEFVATHGVKGLLRFRPYGPVGSPLPTDRPLYLTPVPRAGEHPDPKSARPLSLSEAHAHGNVLLVRVPGIDSIEAATPLVGQALAIAEEHLPAVAPGEFYVFQLAGLDVVTNQGARIGTIDGSFSTGANEVLVVRDGGREYLIPVIADVVRSIDVPGGRVVIEPMEGLLDT